MRTIGGAAAGLALALSLAILLPACPAAQELREQGRWGASLGILAEPSPSVLSAGVSYDLAPDLRLHAAAGAGASPGFLQNTDWATYGAGLTYIAFPQKPLSPTIGASMNYARLESSTIHLWGPEPEKERWNTLTLGLNAGLDWQTRPGFNLAFGGLLWVDTGDTPFRDVGGLPYLRFGWLF